MFLLKEKEDVPAIFTEMGELSDKEWRETARWVKFEEDVEQGSLLLSFLFKVPFRRKQMVQASRSNPVSALPLRAS